VARFPTAVWQRVHGSKQPSRRFRASLALVSFPRQSVFLLNPVTRFIGNQEDLCFHD